MTLDTAATTLSTLATLAYMAGTVGYLFYLFRQKDWLQNAGFAALATGFCIHGTSVVMLTLAMKALPAYNLNQNLSLAALAVAGAFIVLKFKLNLKILGAFASPLITIIMLSTLIFPESTPAGNSVLSGFWLTSHILLIFTGDAALALSCGAAILYLLQENAIKNKKRGFFYKRLPPLDLLDSTSYSCLVTGFALLTFGLITGSIYAKAIWGRFWGWDPKEIWSAVTWLVYAALLHGRLTSGWRGRQSAIMTIIGFAILIFTFLGVNFLIGGHHQAFTR